MGENILLSSASEEWGTPNKLFIWAGQKYGPFTIDLAATAQNTLVKAAFYTKEDDALSKDWAQHKHGWLNPPYGKGNKTGRWIQKAFDTAKAGGKLTLLLPCRSDTAWFHEILLPHGYYHFIKGRLTHIDWRGHGEKPTLAPATFPSVVLHLSPATLDNGAQMETLLARDFNPTKADLERLMS